MPLASLICAPCFINIAGKVTAILGREGQHSILCIRTARQIPGQFPIAQTIRLILLHALYLCEDEFTVRQGVIFIGDFRGWGWANFKLEDQKRIVDTVQHRLPLRYHAVFAVDTPWVFRTAFALLSPFMKAKFRERMRLIPSTLLPDHVPLHVLPDFIGGAYVHDAPAVTAAVERMALALGHAASTTASA